MYSPDFAKRITLGNFDDDLPKIKDYDWVLEAIVERLDIKKGLFEKVDALRKPGTLVSSNTSGIPVHLIAEGRSEDFRRHFCGTHFFNPPRYLRLFEVIPTPDTDPQVVEFLLHYADLFLGKTAVLAKDTPAFIANRVGIYSLVQTIRAAQELGLSVAEVDKLTADIAGRPKSGTFRLSDVVGLDTTVHVAKNLFENLPDDESRQNFQLPPIMQQLMEKKWLGDKTGQGFYKKTKDENGKSVISGLNLSTLEYEPSTKIKLEVIDKAKKIESLKDRFAVLLADKGKAGEFYRRTYADQFQYAAHRIPEISDELYRLDEAIKTGFGWQMGLFETWDAIGVEAGIQLIESQGLTVADWVREMLAAGHSSFYLSLIHI